MASLLSQTTIRAFSGLSISSPRNVPCTHSPSLHSNFCSKSSGAVALSSSSSSSSFLGSSPVVLRRPAVKRAAVKTMAMAADKTKKAPKKLPTIIKRAKQAEVKRIYHKSRKSEMSTRMKKVFLALDSLKNAPSPSPETLVPVEKLISEAYKIIDKSVKVGTIHANKGARRKSRLARAKRAVSIALGLYVPKTETETVTEGEAVLA